MAADGENIALAFKHLSVATKKDCKVLLYNATGYVQKGSITAVMGASAAGKSLLLQTLAARVQDLTITGEVFMDGAPVDPRRNDNPISYVPQGDSVVGELTAREVTTNSAMLKRNEPMSVIEADVQKLMDSLGLAHVCDGIIGTLIFRGISGGQKKRVEIAAELIASPSILLLDEPTSGLDSSIAFEVLSCIRDLVKSSDGKLSVMLSIHQPNSRILELFDNLMLIDQGGTVYFGSVPGATPYFSKIGFACPPSVTPTDYFLQVSDSNFNTDGEFDFEEAFAKSAEHAAVLKRVEQHAEYCKSSGKTNDSVASVNQVPWYRQFYVLVYREYALAYRDPTLYYFQVGLVITFALLTGMVFYQMRREISQLQTLSGGLLWLTLMFSWIHAFKVYHISKTDRRTVHEVSNGKYSATVFVFADLFASASLGVLFFPVIPISYFMMGFPQEGVGPLFVILWMAALGSEAMLNLICKFSHNATVSMIFAQIALVNLMVFAGGVFIPWDETPPWWIWLQETAIFTQASRTVMMAVYAHFELICYLTNGQCVQGGTGTVFPCNRTAADNLTCFVKGREALFVTQGIGSDDSYWYYFCYLTAIFLFFKAGVWFFNVFPFDRVVYWVANMNAIDQEEQALLITKCRSSRKEQQKEAIKTSHHGSKPPSMADFQQVSQEEGTVAEEGKGGVLEEYSKKMNGLPEDIYPSGPSLSWRKLSVILPKSGRRLVNEVSGFVSSGRVLALMGPSGAGKTTLLNGLAHRADYADIVGEVLFAGRAMTPSDLTYVPQFDEVNGMLTVREHMLLVGKLTSTNKEDMLARLDKLLDVLGLAMKADVKVRDLSGGEVKRVSVGIGMVSNPHILFLDEPTTGLDSTAAFSIVSYLVKVAKETNVAVIMTIHQPSALVFGMLDDLLLLENGKTAYGGSIPRARKYFASIGYENAENINPADYYLDIIQQPSKDGREWNELFATSPFSRHFQDDLDTAIANNVSKALPRKPSFVTQYLLMFQYFMHYFFVEKGFYFYRLLALIVIAIFVGTLFLDLQTETKDINLYVGAMFYSAIAVMLTAISATAILAKDRREAVDRVANGIFAPGVFVCAQFSAQLIYDLGVSFVFVSIFHWLTNINPRAEVYFFDVLINWGHLALMESFLLVVIEVLKNDFLSTTFGMIFLGSLMAFAGFFRPVAEIPPWISWMCYALPLKWSFDGFIYQIFHTQDFSVTGANPPQTISGDQILSDVFKNLGADPWGLFGALMGYVVLFRVMHYALFAFQTGNLLPKRKEGADKAAATLDKREVAPLASTDDLQKVDEVPDSQGSV